MVPVVRCPAVKSEKRDWRPVGEPRSSLAWMEARRSSRDMLALSRVRERDAAGIGDPCRALELSGLPLRSSAARFSLRICAAQRGRGYWQRG